MTEKENVKDGRQTKENRERDQTRRQTNNIQINREQTVDK